MIVHSNLSLIRLCFQGILAVDVPWKLAFAQQLLDRVLQVDTDDDYWVQEEKTRSSI